MATTLKVSLIGFMALSLLATSEAGFPRLHFSGQFLADTSTLNNDPYNYNIDNFNINRDPPCYPNYTFPHCNWNPKGSGDFRLVNCTVTKVCYQNGKCTTQDPIVGKRITGSDDTVAAKMVDLDPYFQMYTSQLWGLVVGVEGAFQGTFKVNTVMDIWQRCKEKGCPGDPGSSGYWSSVLENVSWFSNKNACPTKTVGTFIDQLKCPRGGGSKWAKTLNIKFTVDVMNEDPLTHDFAHGRVIGSISSVDNEEALKLGFPEFNRMLWGQGVMAKPPILPEMKDYHHAPFYVDDINKKVVVDLSNSLPTHLNGTLVDGGNLFLLLVQPSELTEKDGMIKNCEDVLHNPNSNVGSIGYTADEWLMKDAGIVILDIDSQNTEGELRVMVVKEEAPPCQSCQKQCLPILVEHPKGLYLGAAEDRVFRIPKPTRKTETSVEVEEDGSLWGRWSLKTSEPTKVRWSLKVFATEFGKPKQDIMFIVSLSSERKGLNKPKDAITFVGDNQCRDKSRRKYTTDDRGIAVIEFQTDREGLDCSKEEVKKRREQEVGGQLYVYDIKTQDKHDRCEADEDTFPPNLQTTTHLYCKHESKEIYYWVDDIYPLFQRYDNLFPVMKPLFNLASYKEVIAKYRPLIFSLKLALEDPNHMPVTRDLSPADRDMLVKWLQQENQQYSRDKIQYSRDGQEVELAELKANLQLALRFEWTTIPLYLSAYYSIKDGFNTKVASLLKSVVIDEMNHMALVANIINAIGWTPVLNDPEVFPTYPGPLPAGCRPDVAVQLAKCSLHQIHDVFMAIEKPECAGPIQKTISSLETFNIKDNAVGNVGGMLFAVDNINFKDLTAKCREDVKNYEPDTIGALYIHKILCPMIDLSKSGILTFDGDQAKQYPKTINVTNLQTAIKAIHQIIDEGEGGDPCDPFYLDPHGNKTLSHYYKFAEIAHGKMLVKARSDHHDAYKQYRQDNHEQETNVCETEHKHDYFTPCYGKICCRDKYEFAGANIPFFENAVWPTLDNPTSSKYPPGSRARKMSDRFNEKYTGLMKCLHDVFNGNPGNMKKCYGLMTSLTVNAKKMVQTPIDPDGDPNVGPNVTPTFEWYPPIN
ncbi:uncharacterized protein LOC144905245 [Branchiostoma floridae x Branchiostoma belcheri]